MAPVALRLLAAAALPGAASSLAVSAQSWREGENLLVELADAVLGNKQGLLPIPFDMVLERDVGYVGEYPLLANSTGKAKAESLGTQREVEKGLAPEIAIASVYIKDSDQPPSPPSAFRMGGSVGGYDRLHLNGVVNPDSATTVWQWQRIKHAATEEWLESLSTRNPEKLVLLHSAGDVLYGGCDEASIKYKYEEIVKAAGGTQKIVVGAEVSPYPSSVGWKYAKTAALASTMTAALSKWSVSSGWTASYANCTGELNSICDSEKKYQYANSGFIMGPASDVLSMLSGLSNYVGVENQLIAEYLFDHPDKVTLDYAGTLFMSLHNLVKDGATPVEVDSSSGAKSLKSKVTNSKVCFVQGNGNSFDALKTLATQLKA